MKTKKLVILASLLLSSMSFTVGCSSVVTGKNKADDLVVGEVSGAKEFVKQKYFDFTKKKPLSMISASNGYSNNGAFGSTWSSNAVSYVEDEGMSLNITFTDDTSQIKSDSKDPFISAEVRTQDYFQYGFFGTYMKPSGVMGTASTFFLYSSTPHDEIDIEFLGRYHNKVQFNYFKNGVGGHEYWYELDYDATQEFHHYGFYWDAHEITWYIDFVPVYRLVGDNTPSAECQLLCNAWVGSSLDSGVIGWMGEAQPEDFPTKSTYKSFHIADKNGNQMERRPSEKDFDHPLTDADFVSATGVLKADSTNAYQLISSGENSFEFQWNKEAITKNYINRKVNFTGIDGKCYARVTVQNLSLDHPTLMRINMDSSSGSGTISNLLLSLEKNKRSDTGQTDINNHTEGIFEINPGETALCQLEWYGVGVNEMTFMFDDFGDMPVADGCGQRDGHVIISDFKFAGVQQYEGPNNDDIVDELYDVYDDPAHQVEIPSEYEKVNMTFKNTSKEGTSINVSNTEDGILFNYSVSSNNYDGVYTTTNHLESVKSVIFVLRNLNPKAETYRFAIRYKNASNEKVYAVKTAAVISDASTGMIASLKEGKCNVTVNGGRTCQFRFDFYETITAYDFCIIPAIAASAASGEFLLMGSYVLVDNTEEGDYDTNGQGVIPEGYTKVQPVFSSRTDATCNYSVSSTEEGVLVDYSVTGSNYTGCYTSYHGITNATSAIFVIKNLNEETVSFRLGMRYKNATEEKLYAVKAAEFISSTKTGTVKSLADGKLTVNINGGKTAQVLITFFEECTLYDCMICPYYGSTDAASGSFLVTGMYKK